MSTIASQITSLTIVYSIVYSDADQRKHQSSASLAFVRRIHRGPVNSPHKGPVTRKMFPFHDVIMYAAIFNAAWYLFSTSYSSRCIKLSVWLDHLYKRYALNSIFDELPRVSLGIELLGPLLHGLTSIPAWISYYTHYNVRDEIIYPFLSFNGATVEV